MKIALYTYARVFAEKQTGGQKRFKELYKHLSAKYDVTLYSIDDQNTKELNGRKHIVIKQVPVKQLSLLPADFRVYFKNRELLKQIREEKYDKIIVFDVTSGWPLFAAHIENIQLFIRQDLISYKSISLDSANKSRLYKRFYLQMMKMAESTCLKGADKIVVQCKYDLECLVRRHKNIERIIADKTVIQINNVNPSWIKQQPTTITDRQSKNNGRDAFYLGFVGSPDDTRKGFHIFEGALEKLIQDGYSIGAYIIGNSRKIEEYRNKYKDNYRISFVGWSNNPLEYLAQCDLAVVPSLADSCPNTVIEPLNAGIPVIGCYAGGIPELINDEDALFEPNTDSLAKLVAKLIDHPDELSSIVDKQQIRKKELEFDWAQKVSELVGIL